MCVSISFLYVHISQEKKNYIYDMMKNNNAPYSSVSPTSIISTMRVRGEKKRNKNENFFLSLFTFLCMNISCTR